MSDESVRPTPEQLTEWQRLSDEFVAATGYLKLHDPAVVFALASAAPSLLAEVSRLQAETAEMFDALVDAEDRALDNSERLIVAEARIAAVEKLHQPKVHPANRNHMRYTTCSSCEVVWPCETSDVLAALAVPVGPVQDDASVLRQSAEGTRQ